MKTSSSSFLPGMSNMLSFVAQAVQVVSTRKIQANFNLNEKQKSNTIQQSETKYKEYCSCHCLRSFLPEIICIQLFMNQYERRIKDI